MSEPVGVVALNLGGPDSLQAVEPFLRNLFADPDVIQLGVLSPLQPLFAKWVARRRAPASQEAYRQIGGRSPIAEESSAQAAGISDELIRRGVQARPYTAMGCWHPFPSETISEMQKDGIRRAVAVPLFPHYSRTTTGSLFKAVDKALQGTQIQLARVERYPAEEGYVDALCDRLREALATLPPELQAKTPILFSAHGLPESYIRKGDPYLDDIKTTVTAVSRKLAIVERTHLAFQSRVGRARWLQPYTEDAIDKLAEAGETSLLVCPVAFTGEHLETLQEIDIVYREHAQKKGITHFARARTVGCHPAFLAALGGLAYGAIKDKGWV